MTQYISQKIISNIFYYFLDLVTVTLAGCAFWVVMGKLLSPEQYGVLTVVIALLYVASSLTTAGLVEVLPRFIPQYLGAGQSAAAGGLIRWSLRGALCLAVTSAAAVFLLADPLAASLAKPSVLFQLLALLLLTATIAFIAKAVLQGLQNFRAMFLVDITGSVVRLVVAVALVLAGWAALGGVAAWAIFFGITTVAFTAIALRLRLPVGVFERKPIFIFAAMSIASLLAHFLILQGGVLVLAVLSSAEAVAWFGVAVVFGQFLLFVPAVLGGAIQPSLAELWISSRQELQQLLAASLKLAVLSVLPFTILFIIGAPLLISIIYTPSYLPAATLFPTFMFGSFLYSIAALALITLYAAGRPAARLAITGTGAAINLVMCVLLIPALGALGAALAFLASQIAVVGLALAAVSQTVPIAFSPRSLWIIPIAGLFGAIIALSALTSLLWLKVVIAVTALVVYTLALFMTRVTGETDLLLLEYFPDRFGFGTVKRIFKRLIELFA